MKTYETYVTFDKIAKAMNTAVAEYDVDMNDEHIAKVRDALIAELNNEPKCLMFADNIMYEGERTYEYLANQLLTTTCRNLVSVARDARNFLHLDKAYSEVLDMANYEGLAHAAITDCQNGVRYCYLHDIDTVASTTVEYDSNKSIKGERYDVDENASITVYGDLFIEFEGTNHD